jgi:S1-C subfamily serine protease
MAPLALLLWLTPSQGGEIDMAGTFRLETATASGSAFRFAPGEVLTAAHVVEGVDRVRLVPLEDESDYLVGTVQWRDTEVDVAVLSVESDTDAPQRPLNLEPVTRGQTVYVVGAPIGIATVTSGEVLTATDADFLASAPVRSGNSGGPVLDKDGNAIGMIIERTADGSSGRALTVATLIEATENARLNPQPPPRSRSFFAAFPLQIFTLLALFLVAFAIAVIVTLRRRSHRPKPIVITLD